jgi:hypothetical protein
MGQTRKQKGGVATQSRARKASRLRKRQGPAPTESQMREMNKAMKAINKQHSTSAILVGRRQRSQSAKVKTARQFKIAQQAERERGKSAWAAAAAAAQKKRNASVADLTAAFGGINPFAKKKSLSPIMEE